MFFKMLISQARHKWPITLLLCVAMTVLVSLYVYLRNSARFSNRSMQIVMKSMGHNLLILPRNADPLAVHLCADGQTAFAQDTTTRLAQVRRFPSKYYVSVLQKRVQVAGHTLVLTGIEPVPRPDETPEKGNMVTAIPPQHARLGAGAAQALGVAAGGSVAIGPRSFQVDEVLPSQGSIDDYRVYIRLDECQAIAGEPGRIHAIMAFLCMHMGSLRKTMRYQREGMHELFPDLDVIVKTPIAQGRAAARTTTSRYLHYLLSLVLCITVVMIAVTGLQEVTERRREVGILLAMGANYTYIVGLYIAKLLAIALLASGVGFGIGSTLSCWLMSPVLVTNTRPVAILWGQLPGVAGLACLVAVLAASLPVAKLVRMDPKTILAEE